MTRKEQKKKQKEEEQQKILKRLRRIYETYGLTYKEMSRITGVNVHTIVSWLTETRCPKKETAKKFEEKIRNYFRHGREYIDKEYCRHLFIDKVYEVFTSLPVEEQGKAIIDIYDSLPCVSRTRLLKEDYSEDDDLGKDIGS